MTTGKKKKKAKISNTPLEKQEGWGHQKGQA